MMHAVHDDAACLCKHCRPVVTCTRMQHLKPLLQEFATDLVNANGGHQEFVEATEWPVSWGTLGEPSDDSPFSSTHFGTRGKGKNLTHKAILSVEDSRNMDLLFHATGPDFLQGCKNFMTAHTYAVFRVPLPELPIEDTAEETMQKIQIKGPRKGYLPVIGVLMLQAVARFAVCCPLTRGCPVRDLEVSCTEINTACLIQCDTRLLTQRVVADEDGIGSLTELETLCEEMASTMPQAPPQHNTDGQDSDDDTEDDDDRVGSSSWEVHEQENVSSLAGGQAGHSRQPPQPRGTRTSRRSRKQPVVPPLTEVTNKQVSSLSCLLMC